MRISCARRVCDRAPRSCRDIAKNFKTIKIYTHETRNNYYNADTRVARAADYLG